MAATFRMPSPTNYHPVATNWVINFSRKKEDFALPRYCQLVEAPAPAFFYHEVERDQMIRIGHPGEKAWADGAKRPFRSDNQLAFREQREVCVRYDYSTSVGNITLEMHQKNWQIKQQYLAMLTSQAMTHRTYNVWQGLGTGGWLGLDTTSMWPSTSVADVNTTNQGAGQWDMASATPGDASYHAIRKSLLWCATQIFLNTNGRVKWDDLRLVIHPDTARAMSNTAEIREYYKYGGSTTAEAQDVKNYNEQYGLPKKLYGIEVVVEDSMMLTDKATAGPTSASTNRQFIKDKTKATILSRQGALDGVGGPSFSTFQLWWYGEQMTVEEFSDPIDRLTRMHITDYYTPVAPALVSGFQITGVVPSGA